MAEGQADQGAKRFSRRDFGCKPMVGKEKELVFRLSDLASVTLKSSFLFGHNVVIKTKSGDEYKFNSDDKKATARFVNAAAPLL